MLCNCNWRYGRLFRCADVGESTRLSAGEHGIREHGIREHGSLSDSWLVIPTISAIGSLKLPGFKRAFFFLYRILNVCSAIYEFDKIEMLAFFHCLQNGNPSRASTRGRQILPDPSAPSPSLSHFQDTRDQDLELLCPVQRHTIQEESTSVTGIGGLDFRGRPLHPHSQHSRLSDYGTTG